MAAPMRQSDFRSIVEPILNKPFDSVYKQRADEWKKFMTQIQGIERNYHEEPVLFGMGSAPLLPEGKAVTYDAGGVLYEARYVYKVYGLAYALTKVLVEDGDHIRLGSIFSEHLAQSMIETKETVCANILNRSFNGSYIGGDGVSLVNSAHPIANGDTESNQLTTAAVLSHTSVENLLIQIRKARDNSGKRIRIMPKKLIVSPDNIFQAEVILKSVLTSGTANNDINPITSRGLLKEETADISRLTSATAWWIQTDAPRGLQLAMRRNMEKSMEGDFETDSVRYKATERYEPGWTNWRQIYGTSGV